MLKVTVVTVVIVVGVVSLMRNRKRNLRRSHVCISSLKCVTRDTGLCHDSGASQAKVYAC
jgi:hypothetical protein